MFKKPLDLFNPLERFPIPVETSSRGGTQADRNISRFEECLRAYLQCNRPVGIGNALTAFRKGDAKIGQVYEHLVPHTVAVVRSVRLEGSELLPATLQVSPRRNASNGQI